MAVPDCVQSQIDMIATEARSAGRSSVSISKNARSLLEQMAALIVSSPVIDECIMQVRIKATILEDVVGESLVENRETRSARADLLRSLEELQHALQGVQASQKAKMLGIGW